MTQYHNIPPVYDKNSRILILGSFPSVKSREAQFFYGHPQNRFWKVMSAVLSCDLPVTVQQKKLMLLSHNIAVWDVIGSCEITGSSDATISSVVPNDIAGLVAETSVATVYKGNIIKNLIMDCQSYTKYRPNETTGGIFVSWRRKEELPTGA